MFEDMTEKQAREKMLEMVSEYSKLFHSDRKEYQFGDRINYAGRVFDEEELINLVDSSLEFWLTSGRYTGLFEKNLAEFLNVKYCSLVNSGSSANLLAFMALTSPLLKERQIKRGDEVITVAASFPTTIAPILQYGAVPVFLDITLKQYNIDISALEQAITCRTKAIMVAHTLGNPFDIIHIKSICEKYNLWLVEDNCDSLGSKVLYKGISVYTGSIGDIGTSSFYPPHHMTMGEGGAVYTSNPLLHKIIRSMRDWGRDCVCESGQDNYCGHRFDKQYGQLPTGYDHKYVYSHFGYNLKATDLQAAIGVAQLKKLPEFISKRQYNFNFLYERINDLENEIILPEPLENTSPSWFGFLITCRKEGIRNEIVQYLEDSGIQTRMLFAGNLIKHPCFDEIRENHDLYKIVGDLSNTEYVTRNTFWVGVYPGMTERMLEYISIRVHEFFDILSNKV
ncbi:MAG: lipopolysaccharide biosynthesis protein RfbH [Lachnospiraceae bacterium]|nr:lipopolysaccharide biosynthesis protein RfbH [Lachnospiraceae bacterium]